MQPIIHSKGTEDTLEHRASQVTMAMNTELTSTLCRPRYEGANIRTWVGFKHFLYLAEEAILNWFRERGFGPQPLFHEHGVRLEVVDCSVTLPSVIEIDDQVIADATLQADGRFSVRLRVRRDGGDITALKGHMAVALLREQAPQSDAQLPQRLRPLLRDSIEGLHAGEALSAEPARFAGSEALQWPWQARYFLCHYSASVQHSAYVRALEEAVDRFLAERGISVGRLLRERSWIPVVSRVRVRLYADANMEETVHTTFRVTGLLKRTAFEGEMRCYVLRDNRSVLTATATITHGYAISRGESAGSLAELDDATVTALLGSAS